MNASETIDSLHTAIRHLERGMKDVKVAGPYYELSRAMTELYMLLERARADEAESLPKQEVLPL